MGKWRNKVPLSRVKFAGIDSDIFTSGVADSAQVQAQIDSAAVTLTGPQTITGIKTFSDSATFDTMSLPSGFRIYQVPGSTHLTNMGGGSTNGTDYDGATAVYGGVTSGQGGGFVAFGRDHATNPGCFKIHTSSGLTMHGDSTGNVGIGTSSPAEQLNLVGTGGTAKVRFDGDASNRQNNFIGITGYDDLIIASDEANTGTASTIQFRVDASERMRINSAGNVRFGTNSGTYSESLISTIRNGNAIEWGHTNTAGYGSSLGANVGSGAPFIGLSVGAGTNNNTFKTNGIAGSLITTDNAGALIFARVTTASADNQSSTESMRILSTGGLTFNGDTAAANALDDYEQGTWTPVLATSNADGTYSMTVQKAVYRKIGNIVFYSTYISAVSCTSQGTGNIRITGLPYAASSEGNSYSGGVTVYGSMTAHTRAHINAPGASYLRLMHREAVTAGEFDMTAGNLGTSANFGSWIFQGFYHTD